VKPFQVKAQLPFILLLVGAVLLGPGCSRRATKNVRLQSQWNAKCKEAGDILSGITDVPSAKAAEPKLKSILEEMAKLDAQLQKSYDPDDVSPSERSEVAQEVAQGIGETQRLNQETLRLGKEPELRAALGETWKKIPSVVMLEAMGAIPKSN
jgi:hypothetical protein